MAAFNKYQNFVEDLGNKVHDLEPAGASHRHHGEHVRRDAHGLGALDRVCLWRPLHDPVGGASWRLPISMALWRGCVHRNS